MQIVSAMSGFTALHKATLKLRCKRSSASALCPTLTSSRTSKYCRDTHNSSAIDASLGRRVQQFRWLSPVCSIRKVKKRRNTHKLLVLDARLVQACKQVRSLLGNLCIAGHMQDGDLITTEPSPAMH